MTTPEDKPDAEEAEETTPPIDPVENQEENGARHSVDTAIFSFLIPLGLTSIVISLSNLWMTKLQQVKTVISLKRRYPIQIDTLKAVVVVVCLLLSAAYLTPFGLTMSNWSHQCQITPTLSLVSYITLLIVIAVFLCMEKSELSNYRKKHNDSYKEITSILNSSR